MSDAKRNEDREPDAHPGGTDAPDGTAGPARAGDGGPDSDVGSPDAAAQAARCRDLTQSIQSEGTGDSSPTARVGRKLPRIEGYQITGILGQGGMGTVYRAVQTKLNRVVALKVLHAVVATASPSAVSRFRHEASAAARLHHTNIVPIYDFGECVDGYYYAMELVTGQPLDQLIRRFREHSAASVSQARLAELLLPAPTPLEQPDDGSEPSSAAIHSDSSGFGSLGSRERVYFQQVTRWMADAAGALHYAHTGGIVHRDIKPSNLILSLDGRIMIADFGLAKTAGDHSITMTGSLVGTLRYMSPEQAMAKRMNVDHRTDVYSLGATMYELLCFAPAFPGADDKAVFGAIIARDPTPPRKINTHVPADLETICLKCMEKAADRRYSSAGKLADDLHRYLADLPIVARRPNVVRRVGKFIKRHRAPVIAVTAVMLLATSSWFLHNAVSQRRTEKAARLTAEAQRKLSLVQELYANGRRMAEARDWDEADVAFKNALALDPRHVDSLLTWAWADLEHYKADPISAGDRVLEHAVSVSERALEIDPANGTALAYKGVALRRLGRFDEAITAFEGAIRRFGETEEREPWEFASWSNLGTLHVLTRNYQRGLECLTKGAELAGHGDQPYQAAAWRNLAALEFQLGRAEAMTHVEYALECYERDPLALALQARILMAQPGPEGAVRALEQATFADLLAQQHDARVKLVRALAHLAAGDWPQAAKHARLAVTLGGFTPKANLILAVAAAHRNHRDAAEQYLAIAEADWLSELRKPGGSVPTAKTDDLWIESADELLRMAEEARIAMHPK